uniref:Uncharacterized protein n=1 Tax=Meloidogyne enterolobii TaxID=390850 RepID=A0A6V7XM56_MELEN|nr:unnamed protein product [Meloidogyne enterolobii]
MRPLTREFQVALYRLLPEEDLFICVKAGISWNARKIIKREFAKKGLCVFCGSTNVEATKKEAADHLTLKWFVKEEEQNKALIATNVKDFLHWRLQNLENSKKLFPRTEGKIGLVLTGDKGGLNGTTKIGVQIADVKHLNSPSNVAIIAIYNGNDDRKSLERLGPLFEQIRQFNIISLSKNGTMTIEWFLCGDYKFICSFYGHKGAASLHPCVWCDAAKPLPPLTSNPRPLGLTGQLSIKNAPLLPIPPENIIPPSFHILHGLGQRLLDLAEAAAIKGGNESDLIQWLKAAKVRRRKRAQNYTGEEVHKLLSHPNPEVIAHFVPEQNLANVLQQAMSLLRDIASLSKADSISTSELDSLKHKCHRLYQMWIILGSLDHKQNITPKLHILSAHFCEFAKRRGIN